MPNPVDGWDLSSDGSHLAIAPYDGREGRIQILPLAGGATREVNVKGGNRLAALSWAADGKGLLVSEHKTACVLLYVDLEGRAQVLWDPKLPSQMYTTWGTSSPNGRYLALLGYTAESNVWMLENF